MKVIKKILIILLTLLLINLVSLFGISLTLKSVLVDGIIKETIRETVIKRDTNDGNYVDGITSDDIINNTELTEEESFDLLRNKELIDKLLEDDQLMNLVNDYVDKTLNSLAEGEEIDDIDLEKDMIDYIDNNREVIEDATGIKVTDEMINQVRENYSDKHLTRQFINNIENANKSFSSTERTVLKGYSFIISGKFRLIIILIMIVDLFLIGLLKKSFYKWIKNLTYAFTIGGFSLVLMGFILNKSLKVITGLENAKVMPLINVGLLFGVFGLLILVIYLILLKNIMQKDDGNVIS